MSKICPEFFLKTWTNIIRGEKKQQCWRNVKDVAEISVLYWTKMSLLAVLTHYRAVFSLRLPAEPPLPVVLWSNSQAAGSTAKQLLATAKDSSQRAAVVTLVICCHFLALPWNDYPIGRFKGAICKNCLSPNKWRAAYLQSASTVNCRLCNILIHPWL